MQPRVAVEGVEHEPAGQGPSAMPRLAKAETAPNTVPMMRAPKYSRTSTA